MSAGRWGLMGRFPCDAWDGGADGLVFRLCAGVAPWAGRESVGGVE